MRDMLCSFWTQYLEVSITCFCVDLIKNTWRRESKCPLFDFAFTPLFSCRWWSETLCWSPSCFPMEGVFLFWKWCYTLILPTSLVQQMWNDLNWVVIKMIWSGAVISQYPEIWTAHWMSRKQSEKLALCTIFVWVFSQFWHMNIINLVYNISL